MLNLQKDYLIYRYYDSISVSEENSTKDVKLVQLKINFGNAEYVVIYPLKWEDEIWKVDVETILKAEESKKFKKRLTTH